MGKNWEWSLKKGKEQRIKLEVDARMLGLPFNPNNIPLHSHCGTMQSHFNKGWRAVSAIDIELRVNGNRDYQHARQQLHKRFGGQHG